MTYLYRKIRNVYKNIKRNAFLESDFKPYILHYLNYRNMAVRGDEGWFLCMWVFISVRVGELSNFYAIS